MIKKIFKNIFLYLRYNYFRILTFLIVDTIPNQKIKNVLLKKLLLNNIGNNVIILPGTRWFKGSNLFIEDNVFININTYFDDKANIRIGKGTWIAHFVKFITATHNPETMEELEKPINIGNYCWIGANVTILPGVTIGDNCIVGAGSVITKDVPPNSVCVGNPGKVIKKREIKTPYKLPGGVYIEKF